jgi:hypothetical protein
MATINDIGIRGINSGGILQPKLKNRWRITFANMGAGGQSDGSVGLSMQAVNVSRPTLSFEEVQLDRYNSRAWVAGKHNFEPMTLSFEDDVTGTASRVVQDQIQSQQHLIGAGGPFLADSLSASPEGSLYKFVTYLDMLDGATDNVIEKWTIEGCFIQNVSYGDLDYAASEQVLIELTLRYDHARQDALNGYNSGQGVATGGAGKVDS